MIPVLDKHFQAKLERVKDLILNEVNVKSLEFLKETEGILVKKIKPDFKSLGPKYGKMMKQVSAAIANMNQANISRLEKEGNIELQAGAEKISLSLENVEITSEDIPGWLVASEGHITVALDITISEELRYEGIARELVNRIQNIRKESNFDVTDKIHIVLEKHDSINNTVDKFGDYIRVQTLAETISLAENLDKNTKKKIELDDEIYINLIITKVRN